MYDLLDLGSGTRRMHICYNWINSGVAFSKGKYKKEYPDIYEPEECLKTCLLQYYPVVTTGGQLFYLQMAGGAI